MKKVLFFLAALCAFGSSCTKNGAAKKTIDKGVYEVCIDYGCTDPKKTANCEDVIAFIQFNAGAGGQQIHVQGHFPDNSVLSLDLLWDGNPTKNTFSLNEDKIGTGNWGYGYYSAQLGSLQGYHTGDGGSGTATVTDYDANNQRISGTFSFKAKYFDGSNYQNTYKTFSGSFINIPIIDPNNPQSACNGTGGGSTGGGSAGGGGGTVLASSVSYKNASFTDIAIVLGGTQKTITPGSSVSFSGSGNANFAASASTSGKTSSGTQVGSMLQWKLDGSFPASGTRNTDLNVAAEYFFLKIVNKSAKNISKLYTNYGLVSQTTENLSIPNDAKTYFLGYYKAYSNSNVRAESGSSYWQWNTLSLPYTQNQSTTVTANP
ncbi:MAG: hypothetical protein ABIQ88_06400 [Chitinophagaceae bacterium]